MESPFSTIGKATLVALVISFAALYASENTSKVTSIAFAIILLGIAVFQLLQMRKLSFRMVG